MLNNVLVDLLLWNVFVCLLFGIDKYKAMTKRYRIRETTLLMTLACCGGLGGLIGMLVFHHKTRKPLFVLTGVISIVMTTFIVMHLL